MHAPPPIAAPRHAAMVTWSISRRAVIARCPMRRRRRCMTRVGGAGSGSVRSAPEVKCRPAPVKTTARVSASSRKASAACSISSM